jgi:hypothetical protein
MNTITAEKEITFTLFYRNTAPGMSASTGTPQQSQSSPAKGLKTWTVDRFGRDIYASSARHYAWEAVTHRAASRSKPHTQEAPLRRGFPRS